MVLNSLSSCPLTQNTVTVHTFFLDLKYIRKRINDFLRLSLINAHTSTLITVHIYVVLVDTTYTSTKQYHDIIIFHKYNLISLFDLIFLFIKLI